MGKILRDNQWLLSRLDFLWTNYFPDISQINPVFIAFGRFARLRFGSIRLDPQLKKTYIVITSMFKNEKIPQEVVDHTIAHELCHYAHGFSSPRRKLHRFPHEGGVIRKEMEKRGLIYLFNAHQRWIKDYRLQLKKYYQEKW